MSAPKGHAAYNVNGEGGRPKKYTEEFIEKEAIALEEWRKKKGNIFIEDFCVERDYSDEYICEWDKNNQRFSDAYRKLKTKQKSELFKGGLTKKFGHPMCALILSHSHQVNLTTNQKISGDAENPFSMVLSTIEGTSKDIVNGDG